MVTLKNEIGFSFLSMLLMLTIISMTIPLLSILIKTIDYESNYEEISVQQFFHMLQNDIIKTSHIDINQDSLAIYLPNGDIANIEQYKNVLRRQVNNQGHEIYHRGVEAISFHTLPYGVRVILKTTTGEHYEKELIFYE